MIAGLLSFWVWFAGVVVVSFFALFEYIFRQADQIGTLVSNVDSLTRDTRLLERSRQLELFVPTWERHVEAVKKVAEEAIEFVSSNRIDDASAWKQAWQGHMRQWGQAKSSLLYPYLKFFGHNIEFKEDANFSRNPYSKVRGDENIKDDEFKHEYRRFFHEQKAVIARIEETAAQVRGEKSTLDQIFRKERDKNFPPIPQA